MAAKRTTAPKKPEKTPNTVSQKNPKMASRGSIKLVARTVVRPPK